MNITTDGHNHGGKSHLLGMLGIGALVLLVLVVAGRSWREALPIATVLACPLMMIGMLFMMRGTNKSQHEASDPIDHPSRGAREQHPDSATSELSPR